MDTTTTTAPTTGSSSMTDAIKIVRKGDVALVEWDLPGEKVNKLSTPVMNRLRDVLDEVANGGYKAAVMISRKSKIFIAGADIEEIKAMKTTEQFLAAVNPAHAIFNKIEDMKIPVIAAINGQCLGGGCEMSLACDYRVASDDPSTRIGLPETKLGIIPGFGGTIRLPRTIGLQASLDIILAGKAVDANKAFKIGLVDQVVPASQLEERALAFANDLIKAGKGKRKKRYQPTKLMDKILDSGLGRPLVFKTARKTVMGQTNGHYPAPLKALDVIQKTYGHPRRDEQLDIESKGFAEVAITDVSKNLINLFFMMESVKKKSGVHDKNVKAHPVKSVGVLGAGTMGGGIAFVAADKGIDARMKDINNQAISHGFKAARDILDKSLKRRKINSYELTQKMNHISGGTDYTGFGNLDVVIEAIVEDVKVKQKVIGETAGHCKPDCIMATNTSSLSVTKIGEGHPNPANFAGMHFFNPVNKMPLVEVIRGEKSSDVAIATIFELSKKMGKTPVVVKDGPGFLVNRLLIPYLLEAMMLLEEGADIKKTDAVIKKKFGMPMGPYTLLDEIGIDIGIKVAKIFNESFGERMPVPALMKKIGELKLLGKKGSKGFYMYDEKGKQQDVNPTIYSDLGLSTPTQPHADDEIIKRSIYSMINEAALALIEERVVETPDEVDLAMIMGTGFPPFRGGLLRYADSIGTAKIVDDLEALAVKHGLRLKPSTPLRNLAKTNRTFYS